jgi:hypothetical protein
MSSLVPRLACVVLLLLTPSISIAQVGGGGSIQGTVLDSSNAAIPGATVTATNVATGIETIRVTTEAGVYSVNPLPPGTYRITITLSGFQTFVRDGIVVEVGGRVERRSHLAVGDAGDERPRRSSRPAMPSGPDDRNDVYTALPLVLLPAAHAIRRRSCS